MGVYNEGLYPVGAPALKNIPKLQKQTCHSYAVPEN